MSEVNLPKKYFDLHLSGLGYLSRVREVNSSGRAKARPFLACSIAAFHGDPEIENGIVYLNLDLIVSGEKAKEAILSVMDDANDRESKVLVGFRAGDHYISTFEIKKGDRAGQMGTVLKGRLLKVHWIKVDGELVYQDERDDDPAEAQAEDRDADREDRAQVVDASDPVEPDDEGSVGSTVGHTDGVSDSSAPGAVQRDRPASGLLRRSIRRSATAG